MLHILHLEDREEDAFLIQHAFRDSGLETHFTQVGDRAGYLAALEKGGFDLILADNSLPGLRGVEALELARQKFPEVPVIAVSGAEAAAGAKPALAAGAANFVSKDNLWQLIAIVRAEDEKLRLQRVNRGMVRLVAAVQELSLARDLESIMNIVRRAARELTGADGASFVLRDGEFCFYADEFAVVPLWKGQRFPLKTCISGWTMLNRQPAIIPDIYVDPRIPIDAYRPTFVKSLVMVPIRSEAPLGAIGNYWAQQHVPTEDEVSLLQALANTTAVAMENVQVYNELEKRVKDRTRELETANHELETFSFAVSHDLRAPLRSVRGFADMILEQNAQELSEATRQRLEKIRKSGRQMADLIEDLLKLARFSRTPLERKKIDLSSLAREITERLASASPERVVTVEIADGLEAHGDGGLLHAALENLLSNAWKYSAKTPQPRVEFASTVQADGSRVYYVRDNGAGFDMDSAQNLFQPFQRLHSEAEFSGTGIGLATVQRIIQRHGGRIWAEAAVDRGATFFFNLKSE